MYCLKKMLPNLAVGNLTFSFVQPLRLSGTLLFNLNQYESLGESVFADCFLY